MTTAALRRFVRAHSVVEALPTAVSLRAFAAVAVTGPDASPVGVERRRALARAMVAQLVTLHGPEDLLLAVVAGGRGPRRVGVGQVAAPRGAPPAARRRRAGPDARARRSRRVESWLAPELADRPRFTRGAAPPAGAPHVVVVCDGARPDDGDAEDRALVEDGLAGVTLIDLDGGLDPLTGRRGLRLVVAPDPATGVDRVGAASDAGVEWFGRPDALRGPEAEALARRLAPCRAPGAVREGPGPTTPGLLELLGVPGTPDTFDVAAAWRPRPARERLRVPFGVGEDGEPVELDLKEAAQEGMGPHGLCVGATGSGKSELLRTLVLGLVTTHSLGALNLVLVDFKGGATFAGLADAPHVAAVITNLADDLALVDRMQDALAGEMTRRQELLRAAGNLASVADYERARERGADLDAAPGAVRRRRRVLRAAAPASPTSPTCSSRSAGSGRSLRRAPAARLAAPRRGPAARARLPPVLPDRAADLLRRRLPRGPRRRPTPHELPSVPGTGYLRSDTSTMVRFKAGYVSGPLAPPRPGRPPGRGVPTTRRAGAVPRRLGRPRPPATSRRPPAEPDPAEDAPEVPERARRPRRPAAGAGPARARGVAAAAGGARRPLDRPAPAAACRPRRGLTAAGFPAQRHAAGAARAGRPALRAAARAAAGRPVRRRPGTWRSPAARRAGKSTLLRTLVCSRWP